MLYKFCIQISYLIYENKKNKKKKKFAKALRNLKPALIRELIEEGVDPNTKFKGKTPLEIIFESSIGSHNSYQTEQIIEILINNGTIITLPIYKKYKNRLENLEEMIETGIFIDAANEDDDSEYIYNENHIDELEAIKVLVDSYDVAYNIEMAQKKKEIIKAIKKGIRAKKGFEVGIANIIVKMVIN
jgi:hypothetical protein|tara:strand:+ start:7226 stop:7786 length:561 start_codon:yes stop_codon:yes gene_type:complete